MLGLVLEGGGAKGAYQMGAWEAFRELGLEFQAVTGTSVGALNGALFAQGDYEQAYDLWYNLKPEQVIQGDPKAIEKLATLEVEVGDLEPLARYVASVFSGGGLDITPLKGLISRLMDEKRLRDSAISFGMVTVSVTDFKPMELLLEEIPTGQLGDYLLASANLPVFKLSRLNGKLYVDGGFYDNLPVNLMARRGIRKMVAVELQSVGIRQPVREDGIDITWITPSEDIGRLLEFNPEKIRRNMRLGYFDTLRVFRGLQGDRYYLEGRLPEEWGFHWLQNRDPGALKPLQEWMGLPEMDSRRFLFEMLLPALGTLLEATPHLGYDQLVLRLFEHMAQVQGLERLQVFQAQGFLDRVSQGLVEAAYPAPVSLVESVSRHLRQNPLYLKARRDEILPWVLQALMKQA